MDKLILKIPDNDNISLCFEKGGSGTGSYPPLSMKPSINEVTVLGDKEGKDYSLQNLLIPEGDIEIEDNGNYTSTIRLKTQPSSGELTADLVVSNPIGKYTMDEVIAEGTGFETIFRGLLSKTYYPTLTDPSLSVNYGASTLVKVGSMVPSLKATLNFNRGSINPQYTSESPYRAGEATGYTVQLNGASVQYSDSGTGNEYTIPTFTRTTKGNVTLNASVSYGAGVQPKDSDGGDYESPLPAGTKTASKTLEFILPFYRGVSKTKQIASLDGMTEDLTRKGQKVYSYTSDNEFLVFAYDSSYGNLKNITDQNGFETIDSWEKQTLTYEGQSYFVYVTQYAQTDTGATFTFKF